jgi:hypothetical protein
MTIRIKLPAAPVYPDVPADDPEVAMLTALMHATERDGYCRHGRFVAGMGRDIPCGPCELDSADEEAHTIVCNERVERLDVLYARTLYAIAEGVLADDDGVYVPEHLKALFQALLDAGNRLDRHRGTHDLRDSVVWAAVNLGNYAHGRELWPAS